MCSKNTNLPLVSIVIRGRNVENFIDKCISSVLKTTYPNIEIIFIDDASIDNTINILMRKYSRKIKIIKLNVHQGPAKISNIGVYIGKGKYIAFLDADTEVTPNWLNTPIKILEKNQKIAAVQCKLLSMKSKLIDSIGHSLHFLGYPIERAFIGYSDKKYAEIFGGKQAALIVRKNTIREVMYFDSIMKFWFEETDLCWRLRLKGYKILYVPNSIVFHYGGGSTRSNKEYIVFQRSRNTIYSLLKNYQLKTILKILPLRFFLDILAIIYIIIRYKDYKIFKASIQGIFSVLKLLKYIVEWRKVINKFRLLPDDSLINNNVIFIKNLSILINYLKNRYVHLKYL